MARNHELQYRDHCLITCQAAMSCTAATQVLVAQLAANTPHLKTRQILEAEDQQFELQYRLLERLLASLQVETDRQCLTTKWVADSCAKQSMPLLAPFAWQTVPAWEVNRSSGCPAKTTTSPMFSPSKSSSNSRGEQVIIAGLAVVPAEDSCLMCGTGAC